MLIFSTNYADEVSYAMVSMNREKATLLQKYAASIKNSPFREAVVKDAQIVAVNDDFPRGVEPIDNAIDAADRDNVGALLIKVSRSFFEDYILENDYDLVVDNTGMVFVRCNDSGEQFESEKAHVDKIVSLFP